MLLTGCCCIGPGVDLMLAVFAQTADRESIPGLQNQPDRNMISLRVYVCIGLVIGSKVTVLAWF